MEWNEAVSLFAMSQRSRGYAPRTIGNRVELAERLGRQLDHKPLEQVVKRDLQHVLARGIQPSSMMRERTDMQAFFRYLHVEGIIPTDPAALLERIEGVRRGRPRPFTIDEMTDMLGSGAYHRTRVMILLGYLHGLRAHEIAKVHAGDFDLEAGVLTVVGKGSVERSIPIHAALLAEIPLMPARGYWFPARAGREGHIHWKSVSDLMTKAKKRAGITERRKTGHSLRHAFGTELVRGGADLVTAQQLLGHASLATTQIYVATALRPDPRRRRLRARVHRLAARGQRRGAQRERGRRRRGDRVPRGERLT